MRISTDLSSFIIIKMQNTLPDEICDKLLGAIDKKIPTPIDSQLESFQRSIESNNMEVDGLHTAVSNMESQLSNIHSLVLRCERLQIDPVTPHQMVETALVEKSRNIGDLQAKMNAFIELAEDDYSASCLVKPTNGLLQDLQSHILNS
jgi:hypothetical protein